MKKNLALHIGEFLGNYGVKRARATTSKKPRGYYSAEILQKAKVQSQGTKERK